MKDINIILYISAALIVFYIDVITPLGYAPWVFYLLLLFIYSTYSNKKYIIHLAVLCSVLLVPGYYLSPDFPPDKFTTGINRIEAVIIMFIIVILGLREEKAKKISTEILDRITDLFVAVDKKFKVIFLNKSAMDFAGIKEDTTGKDLFEIVPPDVVEFTKVQFHQALLQKEPVHFKLNIQSLARVVEVSVYSSEKGLSALARDITEKVTAEKKLMNLLQEKEMLLREMHHRTKNNFQLVLSLLNLQIYSIKDKLAVQILNETRSRLNSVTILYDRLFKSGDIHTINLHTFISDIILNMETAANYGVLHMDHDLQIEDTGITIDAAIPIGLIINELYTNSLKYAFEGAGTGKVSIQMNFPDDETLIILYKDNGKGLPEGFDLYKSKGLGISIIAAFVDQLEGNITCSSNYGAVFEMKLKVRKHPETLEALTV